MNELERMSEAIRQSGDHHRQEWEANNARLLASKVLHSNASQEDPGFSTDFFLEGEDVVAYSRRPHGYDRYPCFRMNAKMLRLLADKAAEEGA